MQHAYDLIIIGGGPAGLTTAIYAARENLETLIIDSKGLGGQAGVTERLDNYPGFPDGRRRRGARGPDRAAGRSATASRCSRRSRSTRIEDAGAEELRVVHRPTATTTRRARC